jgi:hypothetical protein
MEGRHTARKQTNRLAGLPQWRMHESARKLLCRCLVFFCGFLPTAFTLLWVVWAQTPFSAHYQAVEWQQQISNQLGLDVEVESAVSLSPRLYRLRAMQWKHPETKQRIGLANEVLLTAYDQGCSIEVDSLELVADELSGAMHWIHDQLLCRAATLPINSRIHIQKLRLIQGDRNHDFADVQLDWKTGEQQSAIVMKALPLMGEATEKISVQIQRLHDRTEPRTHWHIQSGGNRLESSLLAAFWWQASKLGVDAGYVGELQAEVSQRQSVWRLDGRIENLSFDELTRSLPQNLAGKGSITSLRATIRNEHLVQASGEVAIVGGGSLPRQWLVQASEIFGLRLREEFHNTGSTLIHFDQFLCTFDWDMAGLALRGGMTNRIGPENMVITGVIAADGNGPAFADAGVAPELLPRANSYQVLQWLTAFPTANPDSQSVMQQQELAVTLGRHLPYPALPNRTTAPTAYQARQ